MKTMRIVFCLLAGLALMPAVSAPASVDRRTPVVAAVEKTLPSVVNIGTERIVMVRYTDPARRFRGDLFDEFFSDFFGQPTSGYQMQHSLGSGVIIHPRGYILTNYHVIERASRIRVTLSDDASYDAMFLAGDEINDLALIKIEPASPLKAVVFARDPNLMLGETVIALGSPFGLAQTVTVGVLSSKNREARYEGQVLYRDILQTDAAVNPGSSGGPLLNIDGELIGINVAIYRQAQNIGFAVPAARARDLLERWLSPRVVGKMWLGFDPELKDGAVRVAPAGQGRAEPGPWKSGDIVRAIEGQPISNVFDFDQALLSHKIGDSVPIEIEHGGATESISASVVPAPPPSGKDLAALRLGLEFADRTTNSVATRLGVNKGLIVSGIKEGSAAANLGLKPGLLITRINDSEISTLDDVGLALENVRAGDHVKMVLLNLEEKGTFIVAQSSSVELVTQ